MSLKEQMQMLARREGRKQKRLAAGYKYPQGAQAPRSSVPSGSVSYNAAANMTAHNQSYAPPRKKNLLAKVLGSSKRIKIRKPGAYQSPGANMSRAPRKMLG